MKNLIRITALIGLSLLPYGYTFAATPAETAFARLKTLAGEWQLKGQGDKVVYQVQSGGHVLLENFGDMVTVYHLDGDSLLMTHYCSAGNQPRARATDFSDDATIDFRFVDVTNLKPGGGYITGEKFEFVDADHIRATWTSTFEGAPEVFELERVKKQ